MKSAILFAAPHRLLFLTGIAQLAATMLWWTVALAGIYFGTMAPPNGNIPASLLHAPILIYLVLPPLFFGFLRTVIPSSPPSVEYQLTELGSELMPPIKAIVLVGKRLKARNGVSLR